MQTKDSVHGTMHHNLSLLFHSKTHTFRQKKSLGPRRSPDFATAVGQSSVWLLVLLSPTRPLVVRFGGRAGRNCRDAWPEGPRRSSPHVRMVLVAMPGTPSRGPWSMHLHSLSTHGNYNHLLMPGFLWVGGDTMNERTKCNLI